MWEILLGYFIVTFIIVQFVSFQKIPMKDFHAEIRAYKDVEDFLNSTLLLLNLQESGLTEIINAMLKKLHENSDDGSEFTLEEARHAIFTQDSGNTIE